MENIDIRLDGDKFDKAVHGDIVPSLPENGDLAFYAKPNATQAGKGMVVITFTVQLPNGKIVRAKAVTTAALFVAAGQIVKGWQEGGHL